MLARTVTVDVGSYPRSQFEKFYNYTLSFTRSSSTVEQFDVNDEKVYDDRGKAQNLNNFFAPDSANKNRKM